MAGSDSDPKSQVNTHQLKMILDVRLRALPKTLKEEEKDGGRVHIKLKRHLVIEFHLIKDIGDNFGGIAIIGYLWQ